MSKEEFLVQFNIFLNIHIIFHFQVLLTTIDIVGYCCAQVFTLVSPWQRVPTKYKVWEGSVCFQEGHCLCFALGWVGVSGESQIVCCCKVLAGLKHVLKCIQRRSQTNIVITVPQQSQEESIYPTP